MVEPLEIYWVSIIRSIIRSSAQHEHHPATFWDEDHGHDTKRNVSHVWHEKLFATTSEHDRILRKERWQYHVSSGGCNGSHVSFR